MIVHIKFNYSLNYNIKKLKNVQLFSFKILNFNYNSCYSSFLIYDCLEKWDYMQILMAINTV